MPFNTPRETPHQRNTRQPQNDLIKITGLFPSKSGKALMGNTNDQSLDDLQTLIEDCRNEGVPLRFLVFDRTDSDRGGPPYVLNVTKGENRRAGPPPRRPMAPQQKEWDGNIGELPGDSNDPNAGPYDEMPPQDDMPQTEPVPRPMRRSAPRR